MFREKRIKTTAVIVSISLFSTLLTGCSAQDITSKIPFLNKTPETTQTSTQPVQEEMLSGASTDQMHFVMVEGNAPQKAEAYVEEQGIQEEPGLADTVAEEPPTEEEEVLTVTPKAAEVLDEDTLSFKIGAEKEMFDVTIRSNHCMIRDTVFSQDTNIDVEPEIKEFDLTPDDYGLIVKIYGEYLTSTPEMMLFYRETLFTALWTYINTNADSARMYIKERMATAKIQENPIPAGDNPEATPTAPPEATPETQPAPTPDPQPAPAEQPQPQPEQQVVTDVPRPEDLVPPTIY